MSESLRDQLSKAYDTVAEAEAPAEPSAPVPAAQAPAEAPIEAEKPGRTAGRERDEKGRLLPGPAKKPEAPIEAPVQAEPHPERPSSWKKDYWDHWTKLDPSVAKYIRQREDEYAKGVSTYKGEYDRLKPLGDAYEPYRGEFEKLGIDPAKQFAKYVEIHRTFAQGTPQQKLATFMQLVNDYQVPVHEMFVQGQDGRLYFNQQAMQQAQAAQQPQQPDFRQLVNEAITERTMQQQIEAMRADTQKYPHFEVLRETMAGLLQAGLAQDLTSAYDAALRLPKHSEIWDAMQKQQRETDGKEKAEADRKAAEAARRNSVSPKSATPASTAPTTAKGLRANLEAAYNEHIGSRV